MAPSTQAVAEGFPFMPDALSPAQRRTLPAREAFARKFPSPEAKREHFRRMAEKANAGRIVLSADQAAVLGEAYRLLAKIANRLPEPTEAA